MATQADRDNEVERVLGQALDTLRANQPTERGELARRYAVTITEVEKALAYFETFVIHGAFVVEVRA